MGRVQYGDLYLIFVIIILDFDKRHANIKYKTIITELGLTK